MLVGSTGLRLPSHVTRVVGDSELQEPQCPARKHWNGTVWSQVSTVKMSDVPQAASQGDIFLIHFSSFHCHQLTVFHSVLLDIYISTIFVWIRTPPEALK